MSFISVNNLKNDILKSWDNDTHRGYAASRVHNQEHQNLMLIVERQPTVDVVPKARLDYSQMLLANAHKRIKELEKAKTEVAREIFAEIEKCLNGTNILYTSDLVKLKKKYTEGDNG